MKFNILFRINILMIVIDIFNGISVPYGVIKMLQKCKNVIYSLYRLSKHTYNPSEILS